MKQSRAEQVIGREAETLITLLCFPLLAWWRFRPTSSQSLDVCAGLVRFLQDMRKLEIKLVVIMLALSLPILTNIFFQAFYQRYFRQSVSFCTATEMNPYNQTFDRNNSVTLKGYLRNDKNSFFETTDLTCKNGETEIQMDNLTKERIQGVRQILTELDVLRSSDDFPEIEVEIIGRLTRSQKYFSTTEYIIQADNIIPVNRVAERNAKE